MNQISADNVIIGHEGPIISVPNAWNLVRGKLKEFEGDTRALELSVGRMRSKKNGRNQDASYAD